MSENLDATLEKLALVGTNLKICSVQLRQDPFHIMDVVWFVLFGGVDVEVILVRDSETLKCRPSMHRAGTIVCRAKQVVNEPLRVSRRVNPSHRHHFVGEALASRTTSSEDFRSLLG